MFTLVQCSNFLAATKDRWWRVCYAMDKADPDKRYIVKAVKKDSDEAANFKRLHALRCCQNRIVPAELLECDNSLLVVMPFLTVFTLAHGLTRTRLFGLFTQLMEVSACTSLVVADV